MGKKSKTSKDKEAEKTKRKLAAPKRKKPQKLTVDKMKKKVKDMKKEKREKLKKRVKGYEYIPLKILINNPEKSIEQIKKEAERKVREEIGEEGKLIIDESILGGEITDKDLKKIKKAHKKGILKPIKEKLKKEKGQINPGDLLDEIEKKKESEWGALKKDKRKGNQQNIVEEAKEIAKAYPNKTIEEIIDKTIETKKGEINNIEKAKKLLKKEESQNRIKTAQSVEKMDIAGGNVKSEIKKEMRKNPDKSIEEVIGSITTSGVDYHNEIAQEALQKDEEFRKELEQIKEEEKKKKESDLGDLQMDKRKKSKKKVEVEDETFSNASEMLEEKAKGVIKKNPELTPKEAVEEAKSRIPEFKGREPSYPIYVKDVLDTRFREKLKEIKEKAKKKESKKNK